MLELKSTVYLYIPITDDAGSTNILHELPFTFLQATRASETLLLDI